MNSDKPFTRADIPSTRTLAVATAVAFVVASAVLVTIVLPAEYGMDPLGTGRMLGLNVMRAPVVEPEPEREADGAIKLVPTQDGPVADYPGEFRVDSRELLLGPYEYIEFKYRLEKDATMVFSWQASADLIHDFHGDADGASADEAQSYDEQPHRKADGSFSAPFSGIHGWFWENPGSGTVTIKLTTAGFFTSGHEFRVDRTRHRHEVGGLDRITMIPAQKEPVP